MRYRVLPYKQGSRSAKALANALGGKVLKIIGSSFEAKEDDLIINWGSIHDNWDIGYSPNGDYSAIMHARNKLLFFQRMREHDIDCIPRFWTSKEDIPDDVTKVVARQILNGHSGAGIVISSDRASLPEAPLYTEYLKKKDEYRVHLGRKNPGEASETVVVAVQRKARRLDCDSPDWEVRNHTNGFVYTREGFETPGCVLSSAMACFEASSLDFGAVDLGWNESKDKATVYEINSAPGLEGQTVLDYRDFFRSLSN